jgi:hypothetical protein
MGRSRLDCHQRASAAMQKLLDPRSPTCSVSTRARRDTLALLFSHPAGDTKVGRRPELARVLQKRHPHLLSLSRPGLGAGTNKRASSSMQGAYTPTCRGCRFWCRPQQVVHRHTQWHYNLLPYKYLPTCKLSPLSHLFCMPGEDRLGYLTNRHWSSLGPGLRKCWLSRARPCFPRGFLNAQHGNRLLRAQDSGLVSQGGGVSDCCLCPLQHVRASLLAGFLPFSTTHGMS